ncbi:MAG: hypothetical protein V4613_05160 [Bacteroidota bacterium]
MTFEKDISPIIFKNCTPCHRPNGGGPFSFLSYHDVAKRAKMVAHVTSIRYMPPWPADEHYSHFVNERILTEAEIAAIQQWYKTGAAAGDTSTIHPPDYTYHSVLGKPDMIIPIEPVAIQNNNLDRFYLIKIPYQLPQNTFVKAVEYIPGQAAIVHHVNGHLLQFNTTTSAFKGNRILETNDHDFFKKFNELQLLNTDGSLPNRVHSAFNYLPGSYGVKYPDGIGGFMLPQNGCFVANDIHYGPSTKSLTDSSKLFVYFSKTPPKRPTSEIMLGTNGVSPIVPPLQIPANTITSHITEVTIFNDISILTINPHMHLIGKSFKAYVLKPNGDTIPLIHIPEWQFRWQYFYTFTHPVKVPKGSTIRVIATFDNTTKNHNNPYNPPQLIGERMENGGASMRTTDEMLQFIITYLPYEKGDENINLNTP